MQAKYRPIALPVSLPSGLNVAQRTIFSGSTGPTFAIFSLNDSVLGADDGSVPYFPIC